MNKIGAKGQLVIQKEVRDQLGIKPGWKAVQILVDGHLEVHFIPPVSIEQLAGSLKPYIRRRPQPDTDEEWDKIIAQSAGKEWMERYGPVSRHQRRRASVGR